MSVIKVTLSVLRRHHECDEGKGVTVDLYDCGE